VVESHSRQPPSPASRASTRPTPASAVGRARVGQVRVSGAVGRAPAPRRARVSRLRLGAVGANPRVQPTAARVLAELGQRTLALAAADAPAVGRSYQDCVEKCSRIQSSRHIATIRDNPTGFD
jgi:hypothetical protein